MNVSRARRIVDAVLLSLALVALLFILAIDKVDAARGPVHVPIVAPVPTPRPTPIVVGIPPATPSPAALPTIPPTDTEG